MGLDPELLCELGYPSPILMYAGQELSGVVVCWQPPRSDDDSVSLVLDLEDGRRVVISYWPDPALPLVRPQVGESVTIRCHAGKPRRRRRKSCYGYEIVRR